MELRKYFLEVIPYFKLQNFHHYLFSKFSSLLTGKFSSKFETNNTKSLTTIFGYMRHAYLVLHCNCYFQNGNFYCTACKNNNHFTICTEQFCLFL